jgi:hypothetical protein
MTNTVPFTFKQPFTMIVAGPTMSGKTHFMMNLLKHRRCIEPSPKKVQWCYGMRNERQFSKILKTSKYPVHFNKGLPNIDDIKPNSQTLIVLDDLMTDAGKSATISELFTKGMHHNNISIILIVQNLYHQGKKMRDISLNANYITLFKNPRDARQITYLSSQMFPLLPRYLPDAFQQATERPHGYLVIDCTQTTASNMRLLTNIFPHEKCYFLIPKKG